jgi:hypothetical protein
VAPSVLSEITNPALVDVGLVVTFLDALLLSGLLRFVLAHVRNV